jgi:hypothetical protein
MATTTRNGNENEFLLGGVVVVAGFVSLSYLFVKSLCVCESASFRGGDERKSSGSNSNTSK